MVTATVLQSSVVRDVYSKPQAFNWLSVPVQSLFEGDLRLEASVYATDAQKAKQLVTQCKFGTIPLDNLINECSYPGRFKRAYVTKQYGEKFFLPSQLNELDPSATKFLAVKKIKDLDALRVNENTLLITRSGTIGNCTIASKTLIGGIFSDDVIRLSPIHNQDLSFIYTYLKSHTGRAILQSSNYGAVIQHIEPTHLRNMMIPNASEFLKTKIHELVTESFRLRDESNDLIKQAHAELKNALKLPQVEEFNLANNGGNRLTTFCVNVAELNQRLEAKYHNPFAIAITQHLHKYASTVLRLGDTKLTKEIVFPDQFKRIYVLEEQGIPFIGGKEILELDPRSDKFLSLKHHGKRIKDQLLLEENMILVTARGTIGKVNLLPKHWHGWAGSHNILKLTPRSSEWAGYLYAWLSSEWALPLITRHSFGAVISVIDENQLAEVPVPLLASLKLMQEINNQVLRANKLRYDAFTKEQEALRIFNEDVLGLVKSN